MPSLISWGEPTSHPSQVWLKDNDSQPESSILPEVGDLIAELIDPREYTTIYDPACSFGGFQIKSRLLFERKHPQEKSKAPRLWGQELNPVTFAMAKMNMFLHDYTDSSFAIGDTFRKPSFGPDCSLKYFDYVVANPMWNQDTITGSFTRTIPITASNIGTPPQSAEPVDHTRGSARSGL